MAQKLEERHRDHKVFKMFSERQKERGFAPTSLLLIYFSLLEILPVWNQTNGKMQISGKSSTGSNQVNRTTGVKHPEKNKEWSFAFKIHLFSILQPKCV